jgi:son of sevenless-like protein
MQLNMTTDMQRFHVPYNLKAIPEVHEYLHSVFDQAGKKNDVHDMYRRRLVLDLSPHYQH